MKNIEMLFQKKLIHYCLVNDDKERMGKIEGGEERFYKKLIPPFLRRCIEEEYINFIIELKINL